MSCLVLSCLVFIVTVAESGAGGAPEYSILYSPSGHLLEEQRRLVMLLKLEESGVSMKVVYFLSEELKVDPQQVILTQALTLDQSRPRMGLKGKYGLFGSDEWWSNIEQRKMPLLFLSGIIKKAYVAGQDPSASNNTVDLLLDNNSIRAVGIYVNDKRDVKFFRCGHRVDVVYALDEMKQQPARDGSIDTCNIALEMAVSLHPVE